MKLPKSWTKATLLSKILAIILFVSLPFIGFYFGIRYLRGPSPTIQSVLIKSIRYSNDCKVDVELNSGEVVVIDITDLVISKECSQSPRPVISADGKYAAFEMRMVVEDPTMKYGASDNTVFVYVASKKNWIRVYEYGAANANKLTISSDNNLSIDLSYEDKPAGTKEFILSEVEKDFEQKN